MNIDNLLHEKFKIGNYKNNDDIIYIPNEKKNEILKAYEWQNFGCYFFAHDNDYNIVIRIDIDIKINNIIENTLLTDITEFLICDYDVSCYKIKIKQIE